MGQPWGSELHTLAQLARRAGISEGRARGLLAKGGLPRHDRQDAGDRPLWWSATIDAWCASTGREVSDEALWLFRVDKATTAPVELRRGVVDLAGPYEPVRCYTVVWDTPHGHVIYLLPLDEHAGDEKAYLAAELIEPRWWSDAVVVMPPVLESLPIDDTPQFNIYRLAPQPQTRPERAAATFGGPVRRWLSRISEELGEEVDEFAGRPMARAAWVTMLAADEIAGPLGTRLPTWITGTISKEHVTRSLAYTATFTVPDTTTPWPAIQQRLHAAVSQAVPTRYPVAWAVMCVDARDTLEQVREAHANTPDSGPSWYLVARPAAPQVPVYLENQLRHAELITDLERGTRELAALREVAAQTTVDDPMADLAAEAITLLSLQLARQVHEAHAGQNGQENELLTMVEQELDEVLLPLFAPWSGPVIDEWKASLSPVEDLPAALRLRRIAELVDRQADQPVSAEEVEAIYRDRDGRYVVVYPDQSGTRGPLFHAEWPVSLKAVADWNDRTVIAADGFHGPTALFALTSTETGEMRIDPVPLPRRHPGHDSFAYGYPGGTPVTTYHAIARCALDRTYRSDMLREIRRDSQLWQAITTEKGPLRLPWPQVRKWAEADRELAAARAARATGEG